MRKPLRYAGKLPFSTIKKRRAVTLYVEDCYWERFLKFCKECKIPTSSFIRTLIVEKFPKFKYPEFENNKGEFKHG